MKRTIFFTIALMAIIFWIFSFPQTNVSENDKFFRFSKKQGWMKTKNMYKLNDSVVSFQMKLDENSRGCIIQFENIFSVFVMLNGSLVISHNKKSFPTKEIAKNRWCLVEISFKNTNVEIKINGNIFNTIVLETQTKEGYLYFGGSSTIDQPNFLNGVCIKNIKLNSIPIYSFITTGKVDDYCS